jgi:hypothetical protein
LKLRNGSYCTLAFARQVDISNEAAVEDMDHSFASSAISK